MFFLLYNHLFVLTSNEPFIKIHIIFFIHLSNYCCNRSYDVEQSSIYPSFHLALSLLHTFYISLCGFCVQCPRKTPGSRPCGFYSFPQTDCNLLCPLCVSGMYPAGFDYMAPPPPYPGPPQNWAAAPPQNWAAAPQAPQGLLPSPPVFISECMISVCLCHCTRQIGSVCLKVNHFVARHLQRGADVSSDTRPNSTFKLYLSLAHLVPLHLVDVRLPRIGVGLIHSVRLAYLYFRKSWSSRGLPAGFCRNDSWSFFVLPVTNAPLAVFWSRSVCS